MELIDPLYLVVIPRYARAGRLYIGEEKQITAVPKNKTTGPPPTRTKTFTNVPLDTPTDQPSHPPTNQPTDHVLRQYSSTYSSKQMRWLLLELR